MPKVTLYVATSLDGRIADADGGIDWLFSDDDYGYTEFLASVDALVMGRRTYEQVLSFGAWPYGDKPTRVFGLEVPLGPPNVDVVAGDPRAVIDDLAKAGTEHVWLVGGAELVRSFRREGLVDRYVLSMHPIVLGAGLPLFDVDLPRENLVLQGTRTFDSGLVQLEYAKV